MNPTPLEPMGELPGFLVCLRQDAKLLLRNASTRGAKIGLLLTNRGLHAVLLFRLAHSLWKTGVPIFPLILSRIAQTLFAVDISYKARIGPGLVIVHGFGVVVGCNTVIEGNCTIFHGVTLGDRGSEWVGSPREDGHPVVERNCMFGAGAKVLGPLRVGTNSVIGANAVVLGDVPPNSIMAGVPARRVAQRPPLDENLCAIVPQNSAGALPRASAV